MRSTSAAPRHIGEIDDARLHRAFHERPVGLADEQVGRVLHRLVELPLDVALADVQVDEAVVVHVLERGVPGRRGQLLVAGERLVGGHAPSQGDVVIVRLARPIGQRLQLVVTLAGR